MVGIVAAEVVVFVLFGPWLLDVVGTTGSLALGAGAALMRWGVMAQTADVTALAAIEPLHGLTFALFHGMTQGSTSNGTTLRALACPK